MEGIAVMLLAGLFLNACQGVPGVLDLGTRRELFVDHHLVDKLDGASLRMHEPVPRDTALQFDQPWEGRHAGYFTVLQDGNAFRMYYRGTPEAGQDGNKGELTCMAESDDGIHWTRPAFGLHEYKGHKDTNIIMAQNPPFCHNFAPFLDTRPGVPQDERYKAIAGLGSVGAWGFVSPDGITWRKAQEEPLLAQPRLGKRDLDSQNVAFWSDSENCYCLYYRSWDENNLRRISRSTSPDFRTWSDPVQLGYGDAPIEELYTNQTIPYFRAGQIYIGLAARFMRGRRVIPVERQEEFDIRGHYADDCSDTVLISTRGGDHYDRTFMSAFVRPGPGLSNWASRTNYCARGFIQTGPYEMSMFVQRDYAQPTHHLERLALRLDGFSSLHGPYAGGEMTTKPLTFAGQALSLNYATSAAGEIRVELQNADGKPIEGYALEDCEEIIGDMVERTVAWGGSTDLSELAGTTVRLRFVLKDADIYALQFPGE